MCGDFVGEIERQALERHRQIHALQLDIRRNLQRARREVEDRFDSSSDHLLDNRLRLNFAGYTYEVDGQTYSNDRIWSGLNPQEELPSAEIAGQALAEFPVGSEVIVYYDPDDPQDSVLRAEPGVGWMLIGLGGAVAAWAGFLAVQARRAAAIDASV